MSQLAIRVDGLGKHYRLGRRERYLTLRDELAAVARAPWRAFQRAAPRASMWALRDVSFELERGDTLGVIGANGAGKSTLLKILSRITEPTSGRAEIHGRIGSLLEVGTGFHPELTGRENVFLSGAMLGMSRVDIARRFDEIVEFAGVAPFVDTPVKQYSSGMAVRLGFAVAAHLDVDILVVDEALAVGDVAFQRKCLGRMAGAARDGRTVLFVSHDLAAIASLTRRAICLDRGTVIASGATADVARHYLALAASEEYDGFSPLTDRPRPEEVIAPGAVRLDWVRTTDRFGEQCAAFPEREPIAVEFGFTVLRDVANLEFITGVASVEPQVVVFLATSPAHRARVAAGAYTQSMKLDPNFLGAGAYSLGLKVLVNGARVDTLHDALRFRMQDPVSAGDPPGEYRKRGALMQFDYRWGAVQPLDTGSADWPARAAGRPEMRDRELVGHLT